MLHTISNSTIDIERINSDDAVVFWQNGVTLALKNHLQLDAILAKTQHCYVLDNDVMARGLYPLLDSRVTMIDMSTIVTLSATYYPQMKW